MRFLELIVVSFFHYTTCAHIKPLYDHIFIKNDHGGRKLGFKVKNIVREAIDLHMHVGPEILPRKHNPFTVLNSQREKVGRICIKSHCYSTVSWANVFNEVFDTNFLIGSVTLNNFVGGINLDLLYADASITDEPFVVWLPTLHSENHLTKSEWEVKKEWVGDPSFKPRRSESICPVRIVENGSLTKDAIRLLEFIREIDCILATGHISWRESEAVVKEAVSMGIQRLIVTHPIYQLIDMPVEVQKELAELGAYIEHSYVMHSIDKISLSRIASQIREVGAQSCILSTDVGQIVSPDPDIALTEFALGLTEQGLNLDEIRQMLVENPRRLVR